MQSRPYLPLAEHPRFPVSPVSTRASFGPYMNMETRRHLRSAMSCRQPMNPRAGCFPGEGRMALSSASGSGASPLRRQSSR